MTITQCVRDEIERLVAGLKEGLSSITITPDPCPDGIGYRIRGTKDDITMFVMIGGEEAAELETIADLWARLNWRVLQAVECARELLRTRRTKKRR